MKKAWVLAAMAFALAACERSNGSSPQASNETENRITVTWNLAATPFEELFSLIDSTRLVSDAVAEIGAVHTMEILNQRIALPDLIEGDVKVYNLEGVRQLKVGRFGGGPSEFKMPSSAFVDKQGSLWVLDAGLSRVSHFTPEGAYIGGWPTHGLRPKSILSLPNHRIAVVGRFPSDSSEFESAVFDENGQLIKLIRGGASAKRPADTRSSSPFGTLVGNNLVTGEPGFGLLNVYNLNSAKTKSVQLDQRYVPTWDWTDSPHTRNNRDLQEWIRKKIWFERILAFNDSTAVLKVVAEAGPTREDAKYQYVFMRTSGEPVALSAPVQISLVGFIGDTAIASHFDDDGASWISRYKWIGKPEVALSPKH